MARTHLVKTDFLEESSSSEDDLDSCLRERCESGRIGFTANELTWVTGSEGSNPSLSAPGTGTRSASNRKVRSGGRAVRRHRGGSGWW
jgi:hypothetical protein